MGGSAAGRSTRAMNEEHIRRLVRQRLKTGALPVAVPPLPPVGPGMPTPMTVLVGVVTHAQCSACDQSSPEITFRYPSDISVYFHSMCKRVWIQECERIDWKFKP